MLEQIIEKRQEKTDIIASEHNKELIRTFFEANGLIPGVEISSYKKILFTSDMEEDTVRTDKYYDAICINFPIDDEKTHVLLINLASKHHGINNMLIDYLRKLGIPGNNIVVSRIFTKPVEADEFTKHFKQNIAPKLGTETNTPLRKLYERVKE